MMNNSIDTHQIFLSLKSSGFEEMQAEAITQAILLSRQEVSPEQYVAQREFKEFRSALKEDFQTLEDRIKMMFRAEVSGVQHEVSGVQHQVDALRKDQSHDMQTLSLKLTVKVGSMLFVFAGFLVAIKFL